MKNINLFWLGIYFLTPLIPTLLFFQYAEISSDFLIRLTYALGIYGYTWFTYELIIASRPKFIERSVGLDNMLIFHIFSSFAALAAGGLHAMLVEGAFGENETFGASLGSFFTGLCIVFLIIASIFFTTLFSDKIPWLQKAKEKLFEYSYRIDFQIFRIIHNIFIFITLGFLLHVIFTSTLYDYPGARWIFVIQFLIGFCFYIYHKLFRYMLPKNQFIVENVISENDNIVTIHLKPVLKNQVKYKPGQFLFIKFKIDSLLKEEHPFSISSNPYEKDILSITAKNLGNYTEKLLALKPGVRAVIDYPYGKFNHLSVNEDDILVFMAGGIGITPFLSNLGYILRKDPKKQVFLLWGINDQTDLIKQNFLTNLEENMANFHFIPIFAKSTENISEEHGYITEEKIKRLINDEKRIFHYFICGPPIMMVSIKKILKNLEIPKSQIHIERFAM